MIQTTRVPPAQIPGIHSEPLPKTHSGPLLKEDSGPLLQTDSGLLRKTDSAFRKTDSDPLSKTGSAFRKTDSCPFSKTDNVFRRTRSNPASKTNNAPFHRMGSFLRRQTDSTQRPKEDSGPLSPTHRDPLLQEASVRLNKMVSVPLPKIHNDPLPKEDSALFPKTDKPPLCAATDRMFKTGLPSIALCPKNFSTTAATDADSVLWDFRRTVTSAIFRMFMTTSITTHREPLTPAAETILPTKYAPKIALFPPSAHLK